MAYTNGTEVAWMGQVGWTQLASFLSEGTLLNFLAGTVIPAHERIIDGYVGRREGTLRHFNPHTGTIYMDGNGKSTVWVPPKYTPLMRDATGNGGTVSVDGSALGTSSIRVHDQYLEYYRGSFREGAMNVSFNGSYGYGQVPADVKLMCMQLCSDSLMDMVRRGLGPDQMPTNFPAPEGASSALMLWNPRLLTREMKNVLDTYRIIWVDSR